LAFWSSMLQSESYMRFYLDFAKFTHFFNMTKLDSPQIGKISTKQNFMFMDQNKSAKALIPKCWNVLVRGYSYQRWRSSVLRMLRVLQLIPGKITNTESSVGEIQHYSLRGSSKVAGIFY
jgi:hypothetical protein